MASAAGMVRRSIRQTWANSTAAALTTTPRRHREERIDEAIQGPVGPPLDCFAFGSQ